MAKKLYSGNPSFDARNSELEQQFSRFGVVASTSVIENRETGRNKGFGFVEMGSPDEAAVVIAGWLEEEGAS